MIFRRWFKCDKSPKRVTLLSEAFERDKLASVNERVMRVLLEMKDLPGLVFYATYDFNGSRSLCFVKLEMTYQEPHKAHVQTFSTLVDYLFKK